MDWLLPLFLACFFFTRGLARAAVRNWPACLADVTAVLVSIVVFVVMRRRNVEAVSDQMITSPKWLADPTCLANESRHRRGYAIRAVPACIERAAT